MFTSFRWRALSKDKNKFKSLSLNVWIFCYLTIVYGQKYWKLRQIWWLLCCPTSLLKLLDNGSTCSMYLYLNISFHLLSFQTKVPYIWQFFPSFHTDSNYGCNTKDFYCCFFWSPQIYIGFTASTLCKKKINIHQMKSFTDPHNGGMNTITAACYK